MTRSKKTKGALPRGHAEQMAAAEAELRRHVAEWVGAVRTLLYAFAREVEAVNNAAKEGSMLGRVIDIAALSEVYTGLYDADCAAGNLTVEGYELPIPNLLAAHKRILNQLPNALASTKEGAL